MGNKKVSWIFKKALASGWQCFAVNGVILIFLASLAFLAGIFLRDAVNALTRSVSNKIVEPRFAVCVILYFLADFVRQVGGSFLTVLGSNYFRFHMDQIFQVMFMQVLDDTEQVKFLDTAFMKKYDFVKSGIQGISAYLEKVCDSLFSNVYTIFLAALMYIRYAPLLLVFSLADFFICFAIDGYTVRKRYELQKMQVPEKRFADYYYDLLTRKESAKEIRLNKLQNYFYTKWHKYYKAIYDQNLELGRKNVALLNKYYVIKTLLYCFTVLTLIIGLYRKTYDIGVFVMLFTIVNSIRNSISQLASDCSCGIFKDYKYLEEYYDFVAEGVSNAGGEVCRRQSENRGHILRKESGKGGNEEAKDLEFGKIELRNVSFTYPNSDAEAVSDIYFTVNQGEYICILGENGSGKTTLSKILNGSFLPGSGEVLIHGEQMTNKERERIRRLIGNAPQEYSRFSVKVRELVSLGCLEKDDDAEMRRMAYDRADVSTLIDGLQEGEETILGKEYEASGQEVSGGEWQRLISAQAYMGNPPILLLDEPTASVDPFQEQQFMRNVLENKDRRNQTVILISHRVGFARTADRIVLMSHGRIIEEGTHEQLMEKQGIYAEMFEKQKELYTCS